MALIALALRFGVFLEVRGPAWPPRGFHVRRVSNGSGRRVCVSTPLFHALATAL